MPAQRKRKDDKGPRRYKTLLHYGAGIFFGFHLSKMFPEEERLIEVIGIGWQSLLVALGSVGGLAALGSFGLIVFQIVKYFIERRDKQQR